MSLASFWAFWTQTYPPWYGAPLTEACLPGQAGKVFIITGGSSGIGYELTRILYGSGAKIYMLTRSEQNAIEAISSIKAFYQDKNHGTGKQNGSIQFIYMDLVDLATVRSAAQQFLNLEGPDGRLDVLFNNAGTAARAKAPATKQGHEYHYGTIVLGGFLLTQLLAPFLAKTAKCSPVGSVRVVWPASILVDATPKTGIREGFLTETTTVTDENELYSSSKTANWFVAYESANRNRDGVVHIAGNPGCYATNIWRDFSVIFFLAIRIFLRHPVHGAETYMFMAFSDDITFDAACAGRYVINDGRWHPGQRQDLLLALRKPEDGGSGRSSECFDWCESRIAEYASPLYIAK
ncbi:hypothetical protein QQS21_005429 [Conoideocrella luteorostrata]|uniref:NAD(P)-binding protein n=1 Tax=Conoideocrella luteorostrata TaxID=1105319 RepID=A0AAJ0FTT6_9HYPO|nr:hypothetical protein QQS21_005429 [Conoideocrella luteorostrata]